MPRERSSSSSSSSSPSSPKKSKRQEFREQRRRSELCNRILVVAGIVLAAALFIGLAAAPAIQAAMAPVGEIIPITPVARPQASDSAAGDPNAPVVIEEFSDYQCPRCKDFSDQTESLIMENYVKTGKVYFIYRSMGLWIGAESSDAAEAAYCAGEQNKYWEYHDILFANWQGENVGSFTQKRLQAFAESLQLDTKAFNSCIKSSKQENRAVQDGLDGKRYGITGTPSFVINGKLAIEGAQPYDAFQQAIEAALAGQ